MSKETLLIAEDEPGIRFGLVHFFASRGFQVIEADSASAAEERFRLTRPDAILLDYCLPDADGLAVLRKVRLIDATVPVIILTAHGTIDLAVSAIKEGADQFFTKPVELDALAVVVERAIESQRARRAKAAGRVRQTRAASDPFLGSSPGIAKLADRAQRVLASSSPILIQGETGSGKGLLAAWLHEHGVRSDEPFVDLNCAGLSREFFESEVFGHEKGAFTGAIASKPGLFELAHRGTLFLDEIGDIDTGVQPKLLKVLEDQRLRRLGDVRDRQVDVRLIAATHHDLEALVAAGRFRGDLFYRISTLPLRVPSLRDRPQDIPLIARSLLARLAADLGRPRLELDDAAADLLPRYAWPGNVRELRNVLERAAIGRDGTLIVAADVAEVLDGGARAHRPRTLEEAERRHIEAVLAEQGGKVAPTATVLGLSRSALYEKLRRYGITPRAS